MKQYFGKYRALVTKDKDPNNVGRIKVKCPSVYGDYESGWCVPCFPIVLDKAFNKQKGSNTSHEHELAFIHRIPKVGEPIWIEFEQGDISKPIWVGTWKGVF